jgi:prolyl-tRNA synthetase
MYWSRLFIPTLREIPPGVEAAGEGLLLRAGYLRSLPGGDTSCLFLGQRSLRKILRIAREEMDAAAAQEFQAGPELLHLARELRSYKQLPQIWYQLSGSRLESYSFDVSAEGDAAPEGLEESYAAHARVFGRIFERCGIDPGRDSLAGPRAAGVPDPPAAPDPEGDLAPEPFHTPRHKTIADIAAFTGLPETSQIKSLVMIADGSPVLALVRGDHQLSEAKLARVLETDQVRAASPEEIQKHFGAEAGSLGPVGVGSAIRIVADLALHGRRNMICGANRNDYHLRNVTPGEDFGAEFFDVREAGEPDARRIGGLARFGAKFAEARRLMVSNENGEAAPLRVGSYWLALDRILIEAAGQHRDADGLILPTSIAPFDVAVIPVFATDPVQREAAEAICAAARAAGLDALLDDRDERPGVKFKDADLIGVPYRITVGKKAAQGIVEVVERRTKKVTEVPRDQAAAWVTEARAAAAR